MSTLTMDNMYFSHPGTSIFENASLSAEPYEITGVLGGNGAGKTTLFDIACGIRRPSQGAVKRPSDNILYLSQTLSTPAALRMRDIANMTLLLSSSLSGTVDDLLGTLSNWDSDAEKRYTKLLCKKSSLCSYGEKRWFFTLTLIASRPRVVILDEPTAGVDLENRVSIWRCLKKAAKDGLTILVSSHDINEITEHCDVFHVISERRIMKFQTASQFITSAGARNLEQAFIDAIRR